MAVHLRLSSLVPTGLIVENIAESEDAVVVSARAFRPGRGPTPFGADRSRRHRRVIEVAVQPNARLKAGDVLFRIDPTPYEAQVKSIESQFRLAELRLEQFSQLQRGEAGRAFDVQLHEAEVGQLRAQLTGAKWSLDKTAVRAPANGYVCSETDRPIELACNGLCHWAI